MQSPWKFLAPALIPVVVAAILEAGVPPRAYLLPQKNKLANSTSSPGDSAPDKGRLQILLDGQVVGHEEFEISSKGEVWTAHGSTTLRAPGSAEVTATGNLKFAADGSPIHYDWAAQTQKKASGMVDFSNGTAKTSIDLGAASPYMQDFVFPSTRVAILDNNLYDQYAVLARLYDWKSGGKQKFPVLIPQDATPGSIDVELVGGQQSEAEKNDMLRVSSPDLEILVHLDANHRLMRLEVPASKVVVERE
jgi:hypothetical protein